MKVPKRSSTSRKLLLGENDGHLAKREDASSEEYEEEYEWKVVCWIDSKVRRDDHISICRHDRP